MYMNKLSSCPKCGSPIVHAFKTSYYLRCNRDYNCWHKSSTKEEALMYPEYVSSYEKSIIEGIKDSIENGDDYYHYPF